MFWIFWNKYKVGDFMSLTKDRVVIVCVVFKYRGFIGVKGYNIDKDSFIDIFYDKKQRG